MSKCSQSISITPAMHSAISEDSDLLAYGCKRVMLKMDKEGKCEELLRILKGLNHERFVAMCVLGGCDYTNKVHIHGMGVGTACRLITQFRSLPRVLDFLCRDKKWSSRFPVDKEEVVAGHLEAERTFMNHKVFDPQTQRVVLIRSHALQVQGSELDASFEESDESAIAIATGVIDPRTGAPRNTALSPAECALIRDCQEKAFCGLEARQLRAEAVSKVEDTRNKLVADKTAKDTKDIASSACTGAGTAERHTQKTTGATVRIATRPAAAAIADPAKQQANYQAMGPPADVLHAFDAFAAPTAISSSRKKALASAAGSGSHENLKEAKRLLRDMKDQGFTLSEAAHAFSAAAASTTAAAAATATPPSAGCGDATISQTAAAHSTRQCASISSLLQFASANKDQHTKPFRKDLAATAGRRDLVTKTRFAHRTKLVSDAEHSAPPFISLKSSAAAAAETAAAAEPSAGTAVVAGKVGNTQTAGAAILDNACMTEAVSGLPAVNRAGSWEVSAAEGPPLKRRSSAAFVKADDTESVTAFSSFAFVPGDKPRRVTVAEP
ncbi:exonuclease, putative [Eimeria brunetti]|uniref:Exonuclease, putative n=1 Tax=Eimeria brunetti TaxID=51314 RepID=U6LA50_9EIME|nr:exonuclease, putative [Eimeria brunetti]